MNKGAPPAPPALELRADPYQPALCRDAPGLNWTLWLPALGTPNAPETLALTPSKSVTDRVENASAIAAA